MNTDEYRLNEITERMMKCVYKVAKALGNGFLEKVYENALAHELREASVLVAQQNEINVLYEGVMVNDYMADLPVQNELIVELKAVKSLDHIYNSALSEGFVYS